MASRGAHVPDSFVVERRLRPIYDWLDAGNYKKAIQECDKVLKKSSTLHRVKALKALALLRMGKEGECTLILNALAATRPTEDATLQAMSMCYRELQQLDQVCKLYEEAVKEDPTNEELHSHLFMAYVRMSNYKCQQQAAMTLFKLQPKKPYYCWAIMSIILQAERGEGATDEKKRVLLLSLAERMIDKLIQENKMDAEPVQLYVMILEALKKYEKIIEVLDGPLGAKITGEMVHDKLPYLIKLEKWSEVNRMCKSMLLQNMDRWDIWKHYLQSIFELKASTTSNGSVQRDIDDDVSADDDTPEKAHEFICKLVESGAGFALRGPYLARFELAHLLRARADNGEDGEWQQHVRGLLGDVADLFVEYFRKFGHKPCCVSDLRAYLPLLTRARRLELAGRLVREAGIGADVASVPTSEAQMQRHIGALQLARLCGAHVGLAREHALALATALALHYQHGLATFGRTALQTEQRACDAYALLAAHLLFDVHAGGGDGGAASSRPLLLALLVLRNAAAHSPSNFHVKLALLRVYHALGASAEAHAVYESLDVKHLQLDSMCHVHCAHLAATGHFGIAAALFDTTLKFFSSNYKDSSEHLTFSYKFGSFLKLAEFMDFRERMNHSYHYASVAVDRTFVALAQCATPESVLQLEAAPPCDRPIAWAALRDNSDVGVCASWDPERADDGAPDCWPANRAVREQDAHLLRLRAAVLRCVGGALALVRAEGGARDLLVAAVGEAAAVRAEIAAARHAPVEQRLLAVAPPSRLAAYERLAYAAAVLAGFRLLAAPADDDVATLVADTRAAFDHLAAQIVAITTNGKGDPHLHTRTHLQALCAFVEATSVLVLVLLVALELTRGSGGRKQRQQDTRWRDAVLTLVTTTRDAVRRVDAALEAHSAAIPTSTTTLPHQQRAAASSRTCHEDEIVEKLVTLNITAADEDAVVAALCRSNEAAVREMRAVLKTKIKLLNAPS